MDINIITIILFAISFVVFYWFYRFTIKLIKQHYNIYPYLYEVEEAEKKKKSGEEK